MPIHLRQICLVAERLAPAAEALSETFALTPCHVDPEVEAFGLENALFAVGSQFLEVVAPIREDAAAARFLRRRGEGGYMVICQATDREEQAQVRARAAALNVRVAWEADRESWTLMQLHPRDMGAAFLEVDWDAQEDAAGNWNPAGGLAWRDAPPGGLGRIAAAELQSDDPEALAARWAAVLGAPVENQAGVPTVPLANAELRFTPARDGRGAGLGALDVVAAAGGRPSAARVETVGARFNLVE